MASWLPSPPPPSSPRNSADAQTEPGGCRWGRKHSGAGGRNSGAIAALPVAEGSRRRAARTRPSQPRGFAGTGVPRLRRRRSWRQAGPGPSGFAGAHEAPRAAGHVLAQGQTAPHRAAARAGTALRPRSGQRRSSSRLSPRLASPGGHRAEPPVGRRQRSGWKPSVGRRLRSILASPGVRPGIKNTAAASSSSSSPHRTPPLPAPTQESGPSPHTHPPPPARSHREPCPGGSELSPQCSHAQPRASTGAHRTRLLSPPAHPMGPGLPEPHHGVTNSSGDLEWANACVSPPQPARPPATARGQRPTWLLAPYTRPGATSLPRHEGDGGEGNPSQDIDFIF